MRVILRGRCSIWMNLVILEDESCCSARCKLNDGSYVTDINHESHFTWQVQYLVTLEDESCYSAHCK